MPALQGFYDKGWAPFVALSVVRSWTDGRTDGLSTRLWPGLPQTCLPQLNAPPMHCGFPAFSYLRGCIALIGLLFQVPRHEITLLVRSLIAWGLKDILKDNLALLGFGPPDQARRPKRPKRWALWLVRQSQCNSHWLW